MSRRSVRGAPEGDRSAGITGQVINTITPAGPGTCSYHWAFVRDHNLTDQGFTTLIRSNVATVFGQDTAMLNAQQKAIQVHPGHEFYNLNIDVGGMWARRVVDGLVTAEEGRDRTSAGQLAAVASTMRVPV